MPKRPLKIVVLPKPDITVISTVDNSSVLVENGLLRAQRLVQIHFVANEYTANVIYRSPQLSIFIDPINTRFHVIHTYSLNIRKETCFFFLYDLIIKIVKNHGRSGKL